MKNFCTVSDKNFLHFGLALYESLKSNLQEDFRLFYLCTDKECYQALEDLSLESVVPLSLEDLLEADDRLKSARYGEPSYEAINVANRTNSDAKYIQFFWCLSPYLSWHILDKYDVEDVLYVDSDIYFFNDVNRIYEEVGNKSIGIVRHRINYNPDVGEYNVGIVYFKKDLTGYQCVEWWKNCLLDTNNKYYKTHGMCGDQKYLELFEPLFGHDNVQVIDDTVGHLAPWNFVNHGYSADKIFWRGIAQDLIYCHFSNFKPDFENDLYYSAPSLCLGAGINLQEPIKKLYDQYYNVVKQARVNINENCFRNDSL